VRLPDDFREALRPPRSCDDLVQGWLSTVSCQLLVRPRTGSAANRQNGFQRLRGSEAFALSNN
jgi:hypothetical protein